MPRFLLAICVLNACEPEPDQIATSFAERCGVPLKAKTNMERPDQYPTVPYAAFVDTVGPAINSDFLNRGQQGFQDIIGALWGRSATILSDEFNERTYPAGKFGHFDLVTATNITLVRSVPSALNQHGIWHVGATATAPTFLQAWDAGSWLDTLDFTFSGRIAIDDRLALDPVGLVASGFEIGLRNQASAEHALFLAGSDQVNWQLRFAGPGFIDTGIPLVDGRWYDLQLCRKAGAAYAFIDGALVATVAFPGSLQNVIRSMEMASATLPIGEGFYVDYHRTWYQR